MEQAASDGDRGLLFTCQNTPTLHHGRFAPDDRRSLDKSVEERLGKDRAAGGAIVVGTQTLEQSLDIDADLLITDLCPMDVLLQRIGRLHRHQRDDRPDGYAKPKCVVLAPDEGDLSPLLERGSNRNGLGPYGVVYEDLRILEATRRLIAEYPEWNIPDMNRELVEHATHSEALDAITQEMGEKWQEHAIEIEGENIAEGQTARSAIIRRDKSFFADNREVLFGSIEERIRTRLGDDGIEANFDPPPSSPFDATKSIDRLSVRSRWIPNATVEEPVEPVPTDSGFTFTISDRTFRYDRWGLRQED